MNLEIPKHPNHIRYLIMDGQLLEQYYLNGEGFFQRTVLDVPGMANSKGIGPAEVERIKREYLPVVKVRWRLCAEEVPKMDQPIMSNDTVLGMESKPCLLLLAPPALIEGVYYQDVEDGELSDPEWLGLDDNGEYVILEGAPLAWCYKQEILPVFF